MVKLAVIDSGLISQTGHHYNQDKAIFDEAIRQGHECEIYANNDCPSYFNGVKAKIEDYLYAQINSGFACDIVENYILKSSNYKISVEADVIFVPTANYCSVYGLSHASLRADKIVILVNLPGWHDPQTNSFTVHGLFMQHAMRRMKLRYPQTIFCANSEAHAAQLTDLAGFPVILLETFVSGLPDPNPVNEKLVLGYFGHNNGVKRGHLIPPVISQFPEVDFLIHENPAGSMNLDKHTNLTVLKGELSPESYINAVNQCDIALLPYDPVYYKDSITNVLLEAICLGKVIVCPHDTLMQQMAADAGVAFHKPEIFPEAIRYAILHHNSKREWALNNVPAARAKYNIERYVKWIIGN